MKVQIQPLHYGAAHVANKKDHFSQVHKTNPLEHRKFPKEPKKNLHEKLFSIHVMLMWTLLNITAAPIIFSTTKQNFPTILQLWTGE